MFFNINILAKRIKPLYKYSEKKLFAYSRGNVGIFNLSSGRFIKTAKLPIGNLAVRNIRLLERLYRFEPRCAEILDRENFVFSHCGVVYRYNAITNKIYNEYSFTSGMSGPLYFSNIKNLSGFESGILCGEYKANPEKDEVAILRRKLAPNDLWEKIYSFPKGSINHIHNIVPDYDRKCVYILTGDDDAASGIWVSYDDFKTVIPMLRGSQQYRSCCLWVSQNNLYFATDTPLETNYLYSYNIKTKKIEQLKELHGSVIYYRSNEDFMIFSTTVEPNIKYKGIQYLITNRLGPGIKSRLVKLYIFDGKICREIYAFRKDWLPMALFQFGAIQFCNTQSVDGFLLYGNSLQKYDGLLFEIETNLEGLHEAFKNRFFKYE